MKTIATALVMLALVLHGEVTCADRLAHPKGAAYSFDLPSGWKLLSEEDFSVEGAQGEDFVEIAAPKSARSVLEISRASQFVATAMGFNKPVGDPIPIEGAGWKGRVSTIEGTYGPQKTPSTLLILAVHGAEGFRSFWLIADTEHMKEHGAGYLAMFKSLEFSTPSASASPQ